MVEALVNRQEQAAIQAVRRTEEVRDLVGSWLSELMPKPIVTVPRVTLHANGKEYLVWYRTYPETRLPEAKLAKQLRQRLARHQNHRRVPGLRLIQAPSTLPGELW